MGRGKSWTSRWRWQKYNGECEISGKKRCRMAWRWNNNDINRCKPQPFRWTYSSQLLGQGLFWNSDDWFNKFRFSRSSISIFINKKKERTNRNCGAKSAQRQAARQYSYPDDSLCRSNRSTRNLCWPFAICCENDTFDNMRISNRMG